MLASQVQLTAPAFPGLIGDPEVDSRKRYEGGPFSQDA
jgi:hypothetical protein